MRWRAALVRLCRYGADEAAQRRASVSTRARGRPPSGSCSRAPRMNGRAVARLVHAVTCHLRMSARVARGVSSCARLNRTAQRSTLASLALDYLQARASRATLAGMHEQPTRRLAMAIATKRREYRRFPRIVDTDPRMRRARTDTATREPIRTTDKIKPNEWR